MLERALFRRCRLIRCRFGNAELRDATFETCNFVDDEGHSGVQFAFARLESARFERCDLSFARIEHGELHGIEMAACNLRGAGFAKNDFSKVFGRKVVSNAATFSDCNLELSDLSDARLSDCDLSKSNLREAVLRNADLEGADLSDANLDKAVTDGARMSRANLRGARISGLRLSDLSGFAGMMISADQQHMLLSELGLDVYP
jgi:fluoroquinolone resistance protein